MRSKIFAVLFVLTTFFAPRAIPSVQAATLIYGFDTCAAPSSSAMQAWMQSSPYDYIGVYIGGSARYCSQPNLTASWITQVSNMGWGLIPIWAGPQAPCANGSINYNTVTAYSQGQTEANSAISTATDLGLANNAIIYYDMEAYGATGSCRDAVNSFLHGWTDQLESRGYHSGAYSTGSAINSWATIPNPPEAVWVAGWGSGAGPYQFSGTAATLWNANHINQYYNDVNETYGGYSYRIDRNYCAGAPLIVNKAYAPGCGSNTTPPTSPPSNGHTIHAFGLGDHNILWQRTFSNGSWATWQQIGSPAIGATSDPGVVASSGRLDVFVRGGDNALWQRTNTNGTWGAWTSLGGGLKSAPDAASPAPGQLDVVKQGNDFHIYRRAYRNGSWLNWEFLSSPNNAGIKDEPSIVVEGNRLIVFARGMDNALWRREHTNGGWGSWISMGGGLTSAPDAASYGAGHIDVVIRGNDNSLYHRYYLNGTWYDWAPLGAPNGLATSSPSMTAANGRVDVFVRGADNALWQRSNISGAWDGWISVGGGLTSGPDASATNSGSTTNPPTATPPTPTPPPSTPTPPPSNGHTIHAFGLGDHNILWQRTFSNGSWATWQQIGSPAIGATSDPGVVASSGRLDVFVRGGDNALWQRTNTNGTWGAWTSLGGGLKSAPDAASPAPGQLDVVKQGNDFHIYRRAYRNGTWLNWEFLSSPNNAGIKDEPSIVVEGNRLIVFARGMDNALWRREHTNGGWGSWISMGGGLTSAPDAASYGAGHIDVVIRGNDNSLYHRYYLNGTWYDWAPLGAPNGLATSSPSMTAANGRVDVFVRGADNALWQRSNISGAWDGWISVGGGLTSGPDASATNSGSTTNPPTATPPTPTPPPSGTSPMNIPYIHQYQGFSSSNCDCGPVAVAMLVRYFGRDAGLSNSSLISQIRSRMNSSTGACINTNFTQLEQALQSYGLSTSRINNLTPAPAAQVQAMRDATASGKPVIALINGPTIGRHSNYGDHWVVVRGFSADGQTVYLNDPDNQSAKLPGWIVGGQISMSVTTFSNALFNAQAGPYGIIIQP